MRLCFIGAGSSIFAQNLLVDILQVPEFNDTQINLHDIDAQRLATSEKMARNLIAQLKIPARVTCHLDRAAALRDADYVVTMMQIGGYKPCTVTDFEIPKKYGLRQTIADTLGIGGIMRALRTIPVILDLARAMERHCPQAWLLNYVNPMAMLQMALARRFPQLKTIGLCHSVRYTIRELAQDLGLDHEEIAFTCAGINHLAFFLTLEQKRDGATRSLYPQLRRLAKEGQFPPTNRVRYEMLQRLGYFVTESSEHFAEYVPWFIKSAQPQLINAFHIPLDEYMRRCEQQSQDWEKMRAALEAPDYRFEIKRSVEYAADILAGLELDRAVTIHGNVPNTEGLITNLPRTCCVEIACQVDKEGIQPQAFGTLPPHLAALMQTNINVQELTVEAALSGKREHIYHAAMLDPHTAAELNLDQIWRMTDDLLAAHSAWLPTFN